MTRAALPAAALLSLVWGVWLGLLRLGWALPLPSPDQLILHGPLMIGGFLGTLIGLERAIEARSRWLYAGPVCTATGAVVLLVDQTAIAGPALLASGSLVLTIALLIETARQPSWGRASSGAGALAWSIGNFEWCGGAAIYRVVLWWAAFLVLTIGGEQFDRGFEDDTTHGTFQEAGRPRFTAVCTVCAYFWLGVSAVVFLTADATTPGTAYDAALHAIFVGFVLSMLFGHAPIVLPAIIGRPVPYHPRFYLHLVVLHVSLLARVAGDLVDGLGRYRSWGGLFNAVALALFLVNSGASASRGCLQPRP